MLYGAAPLGAKIVWAVTDQCENLSGSKTRGDQFTMPLLNFLYLARFLGVFALGRAWNDDAALFSFPKISKMEIVGRMPQNFSVQKCENTARNLCKFAFSNLQK